jgi:hypothetical protein
MSELGCLNDGNFQNLVIENDLFCNGDYLQSGEIDHSSGYKKNLKGITSEWGGLTATNNQVIIQLTENDSGKLTFFSPTPASTNTHTYILPEPKIGLVFDIYVTKDIISEGVSGLPMLQIKTNTGNSGNGATFIGALFIQSSDNHGTNALNENNSASFETDNISPSQSNGIKLMNKPFSTAHLIGKGGTGGAEGSTIKIVGVKNGYHAECWAVTGKLLTTGVKNFTNASDGWTTSETPFFHF